MLKTFQIYVNFVFSFFTSYRPFKDDCMFCNGTKGGVLGNENLTGWGEPMCDYCSVERGKDCEHNLYVNNHCGRCGKGLKRL